jgi:TOTE conflict system, Archaeo-Eukaryotic Primase domain
MRKTSEKIKIFRNLFIGLPNVYGTYGLSSGTARQVKAPVTNEVFLRHLQGYQVYGVYLLVKDRTRALVVDFDSTNKMWPFEFLSSADHYGIEAYIERSKSKGFHVWIFFDEGGVPAFKARVVAQHILDEIEQPSTEIFPKQDRLEANIQYGNFIYAPLFGALVPRGKTVFVDPGTYKPYQDQWSFLESVKTTDEAILDEIIEINDLPSFQPQIDRSSPNDSKAGNGFGLPPCARKMLNEGVTKYQRVSCFRLAANLNKIGIPYEMAELILKRWATKNKPVKNKRIITNREIIEQTAYAYSKGYQGYGCETEAVSPFCIKGCALNKGTKFSKKNHDLI